MTQQPYYPPQPQQAYPPQAPPPAQPQYPAYPPQQAAPQYPGYPPAPPQGYAPAQAPPPLATGTIDDFYNQPSSGGGAALKFDQVGTRYIGIVTRPIGSGDVMQQTNTQQIPQFFKDGRPKLVMKVPLQMQPSPQYPDGLAQWYVKGAARDELVRAMAEAGAPEGAPEAGAVLDITFSGTRSAGPGMNDAKLFTVRYTRPQGAAPVQAAPVQQPAAAPEAPAAPSPVAGVPVAGVPEQYAQPVATAPVMSTATGAPVVTEVQVPTMPAPAAPPAAAAPPAPAPAQPAAPQPPPEMSPEQQALLAQLTQAQG